MRRILTALAVVGGAVAAAVATIVAIGATLPVAHLATRSQTFGVPRKTLWDLTVAEFERTNDGSYAIVEREEPDLLVTAIVAKNRPFGGSWSYRFSDNAAGSTLVIVEHGEVYNPFFRFVSRYLIGHTRTLDGFFARLSAAAARKG